MTYPKSHSCNVTGLCHKASGTYKPSPPNAPEYLIPRSSTGLLRSSALACTALRGGGGEGGVKAEHSWCQISRFISTPFSGP